MVRVFLQAKSGAVAVEFALILALLAVPMLAGGMAVAPIMDLWISDLQALIAQGLEVLALLAANS